MTDQTDLDRAVAAFTAAVALDRYRIGAWLRERGRGDIARAVEHGDHLDDDQPAIPSLRLVMAARDMHMQRADDAEAEVKRLRDLVREAYMEGWHDAPYAGDDDDVNNFWQKSDALADLDKPR